MTPVREPKATIKIPRPLYNRLKTIIDGSGFDSVTDFVVYVLRDFSAAALAPDSSAVPAEPTAAVDTPPENATPSLTSHEIRKVRDRLKRLGYL